MIKIEFDAGITNKGNGTMKMSHQESNTLEVEFLIAELINLIKNNDSEMRDNQIMKDVKTILSELNNKKKEEKNNGKRNSKNKSEQ